MSRASSTAGPIAALVVVALAGAGVVLNLVAGWEDVVGDEVRERQEEQATAASD